MLGLGKFVVMASYGHIRDLAKEDMGVDIEHGFTPNYITIPDKQKRVKELIKASREADMVWLATDLDREGEAISWHIKEVLKLPAKKAKRITFNEITAGALERALRNPRAIDTHLFEAQQARRVLDRVIGFKLTQLLWKTFKSSMTLSAGRVQSAVLHLLVSKETDIAAFETEAYWHAHADFNLGDILEIKGANMYRDGETTMTRFNSAADVERFLHRIRSAAAKLRDVKLSKHTVKPDAPYTTSSMQQDASGKLSMSIARSMKVAQDLYEAGHITYMRTDSIHLSNEAVSEIREWVQETYGDVYNGAATTSTTVKGVKTQEAHEAIRPTKISKLHLDTMTKDHHNLYNLIWKRTVASRMASAIYQDIVSRVIMSDIPEYYFKGSVRYCQFDGFMRVWATEPDTSVGADTKAILASVKDAATTLKAVHIPNTWSVPPARYNESALVRTMESEGIGRPSTYASILAKLYEKNYVEVQNVEGPRMNYKHYEWKSKASAKTKAASASNPWTVKEETKPMFMERSKLLPSVTGRDIDNFLSTAFPKVVSSDFTADMESELDRIASGENDYKTMMQHAYDTFMEFYGKIILPKRGEKASVKSTENVFSINGVDYIVRVARYGPVVQVPGGEKPSYINLKPYLKMRKMALEDITEKDIALLVSLPRALAKDITLHYGQYGFYAVKDGANQKIFPQWIDGILSGDTDGLVESIRKYAAKA